MSCKNPRLVKVKTIIPSEYVKEILSNNSALSFVTRSTIIRHIDDKSIDIIKNSDDNSSLIQKDIDKVYSLIEKVLYLSIASLIISTLTLCIC